MLIRVDVIKRIIKRIERRDLRFDVILLLVRWLSEEATIKSIAQIRNTGGAPTNKSSFHVPSLNSCATNLLRICGDSAEPLL